MPQGGGGGLTTFDRLLSPNQGRFALIKVKSPTSPQGGGGVSRNNDRRITSARSKGKTPKYIFVERSGVARSVRNRIS